MLQLMFLLGAVSSVIVKYGTNDQLVNEAEMYQDNGDIWAGTIPAQQGNIVLQMRVFATVKALRGNQH